MPTGGGGAKRSASARSHTTRTGGMKNKKKSKKKPSIDQPHALAHFGMKKTPLFQAKLFEETIWANLSIRHRAPARQRFDMLRKGRIHKRRLKLNKEARQAERVREESRMANLFSFSGKWKPGMSSSSPQKNGGDASSSSGVAPRPPSSKRSQSQDKRRSARGSRTQRTHPPSPPSYSSSSSSARQPPPQQTPAQRVKALTARPRGFWSRYEELLTGEVRGFQSSVSTNSSSNNNNSHHSVLRSFSAAAPGFLELAVACVDLIAPHYMAQSNRSGVGLGDMNKINPYVRVSVKNPHSQRFEFLSQSDAARNVRSCAFQETFVLNAINHDEVMITVLHNPNIFRPPVLVNHSDKNIIGSVILHINDLIAQAPEKQEYLLTHELHLMKNKLSASFSHIVVVAKPVTSSYHSTNSLLKQHHLLTSSSSSSALSANGASVQDTTAANGFSSFFDEESFQSLQEFSNQPHSSSSSVSACRKITLEVALRGLPVRNEQKRMLVVALCVENTQSRQFEFAGQTSGFALLQRGEEDDSEDEGRRRGMLQQTELSVIPEAIYDNQNSKVKLLVYYCSQAHQDIVAVPEHYRTLIGSVQFANMKELYRSEDKFLTLTQHAGGNHFHLRQSHQDVSLMCKLNQVELDNRGVVEPLHIHVRCQGLVADGLLPPRQVCYAVVYVSGVAFATKLSMADRTENSVVSEDGRLDFSNAPLVVPLYKNHPFPQHIKLSLFAHGTRSRLIGSASVKISEMFFLGGLGLDIEYRLTTDSGQPLPGNPIVVLRTNKGAKHMNGKQLNGNATPLSPIPRQPDTARTVSPSSSSSHNNNNNHSNNNRRGVSTVRGHAPLAVREAATPAHTAKPPQQQTQKRQEQHVDSSSEGHSDADRIVAMTKQQDGPDVLRQSQNAMASSYTPTATPPEQPESPREPVTPPRATRARPPLKSPNVIGMAVEDVDSEDGVVQVQTPTNNRSRAASDSDLSLASLPPSSGEDNNDSPAHQPRQQQPPRSNGHTDTEAHISDLEFEF